ncbi:MAG: DUF4198 domain-containing protein [Acidobacteria bacterium]|nr:DUF4198 domain-containing protein [Acidobacteriota bacterium]
MAKRKITVFITIIIVWWLWIRIDGYACTCAWGMPICQAYGTASAVFIGQVTEISTITLEGYDHSQGTARPFLPRYHPGVKDPSQAITISVGEGEEIENYNLQVPALPREHTLEGAVLWQDGNPAAGAEITYVYRNFNWKIVADKEGRFSLKLAEGLTYSISAHIKDKNDKIYIAESIKIEAGKIEAGEKIEPIRFILKPR